MRRIAFLLLAAASLAGAAAGETRPRYGGTLRVMTQAAPNSLALATSGSSSDYWDSARILTLVADNLTNIDVAGHPNLSLLQPSPQTAANGKGMQCTLRRGVKFHDNSPLTAETVAQILSERNPEWTVRVAGETLTIESNLPTSALGAELALPRNAIFKRNASGWPVGTGPFRVVDFQPGKFLKLAANEESWAGRPFVDAIEIEMGRSLRDQAIALELGKTDLIEVMPQPSGLNSGSKRISTSLPVELLALVFPATSRAQDARVREALALAIDRKPIQSALLRGAGELTASILPNWMTGYSPAFPVQSNVQRAKAVLAESRQPVFTVSYDPRDPQAQLVAERIALNAREAGITLQVSLSGTPDINLIRIVLPSTDPATALRAVARTLGLPPPLIQGYSVDELYSAERSLLDVHTVIPLIHLPVASATGSRVRNWQPGRTGDWNLSEVWLEADSR